MRALRSRAVVDVDELTPVEQHNGFAYKRDDLFMPFADIDLNGGKVRQAMMLVANRLDDIKRDDDSLLLTATGVHSPQGLIIARTAHEYGLDCRLFIGATTTKRALAAHRMLRTASRFADFDDTTGIGYETALASTIDKWRARHHRGFPIRFGMNLDSDPEAIVASTARQTINVPDDVRCVVIPVGAGITAAGIIDGLRTYRPNVDRIVCIQIAGHDRRKTIDRITEHRSYEFVSTNRHAYAHHVRKWVASGFLLDPIYEAKAHELMMTMKLPEQTLFWVIGNSAYVR